MPAVHCTGGGGGSVRVMSGPAVHSFLAGCLVVCLSVGMSVVRNLWNDDVVVVAVIQRARIGTEQNYKREL